jgi:hypothetical protein
LAIGRKGYVGEFCEARLIPAQEAAELEVGAGSMRPLAALRRQRAPPGNDRVQ